MRSVGIAIAYLTYISILGMVCTSHTYSPFPEALDINLRVVQARITHWGFLHLVRVITGLAKSDTALHIVTSAFFTYAEINYYTISWNLRFEQNTSLTWYKVLFELLWWNSIQHCSTEDNL